MMPPSIDDIPIPPHTIILIKPYINIIINIIIVFQALKWYYMVKHKININKGGEYMEFFMFIFISIIIEGIISYFKEFFVDGVFQWQVMVAIVIGIFVAAVYNIDIFEIVGLKANIPYVGNVLSGILISRGSNYIFDVIKKIKLGKETGKI